MRQKEQNRNLINTVKALEDVVRHKRQTIARLQAELRSLRQSHQPIPRHEEQPIWVN